jgi:anthranilate synthase component 2
LPRLLLLDNYDSFTWNLAQYLEEIGARVEVILSDRISVAGVLQAGYDGVVISPGPGRPDDAGISLELIAALGPETPLLGVCLGHQAIAQAWGGRIVQAPTLMHGKTSEVRHDGSGLFSGLDSPLVATRYHSLTIEPTTLDARFAINARTGDGTIMGIRHLELPVHGVQFHPESILTPAGKPLLRNFVEQTRRPACPAC